MKKFLGGLFCTAGILGSVALAALCGREYGRCEERGDKFNFRNWIKGGISRLFK